MKKDESVLLEDLDVPIAIRQKLSSLGSSVAEINGEITSLEEIKKAQMAIISSLGAEYDLPNIKKTDVFTLSLCQGKLTLREQLLLEEGIPAATIEACKARGNSYYEVRRASKKKE
jgi:hypothetical protein